MVTRIFKGGIKMFFSEGSTFPPEEWAYWYDKYAEWASWYSGDSDELLKYYSCKLSNLNIESNMFWAKLDIQERADAIHFPIAGDIAGMSSNLLFSEAPRFGYEKDNKAGERIDAFMTENGFLNILLETSELTASLSGAFLKLDVDKRLSELPLLSVITPNNAFPTFLRGRLWEILFYREVKSDKSNIYRLFENRKRTSTGDGYMVEYRLYRGSEGKLGHVVDLNSIDETASLNLQDTIHTKVNGLGVVYIPNMRPNKLVPGSSLGINDYQGCISLMDSLDFAWTSWVRDIELGMGQIFVDEEILRREETSAYGAEKSILNSFSKFQKCFMKLNLGSYRMAGSNTKPIDIVQFEMRVDEHMASCDYMCKQIINMAGYSLSTFGFDEGGRSESGTALRIRERKSWLTREKKSRYWQPVIMDLLLQMQQLDNSVNTIFYDPEIVTVEMEDSIAVDAKEQSETVRNLEQAKAISTLTKVKLLHPDWDEKAINEEVDKILDESGVGGETFNNTFNAET